MEANPLIDIQHVSKKFGKNSWGLKNLSLSIPTGTIFGIIGLSGAGKSTLLRCLTGLDRPTSGKILLNGEEMSQASGVNLLRLRQQMGMIFQHFQLFSSRTAAENIAFPLEVRGQSKEDQKARVTELLDLVGLSGKGDHYPSQLSGGEKQRIGIARALAHRPKLLLCDEPTSALDAKTTRSILDLLTKLNKELGLTIVMITHQLEAVKQICQRLAVLSKGEIVEEGSVIDLFTQPKHEMTQHLLLHTIQEIPEEWLSSTNLSRLLVRISFRGNQAKEPVVSYLIKNFGIDINILSGSLDAIQNQIVGHLLVELTGEKTQIDNALNYLNGAGISYEVMDL